MIGSGSMKSPKNKKNNKTCQKKSDTFFIKTLIVILLIVTTIITLITVLPSHPFKYLKILNNPIKLRFNKTNYNIKINCEKLNDPNIQIVDYRLRKVKEDNNISVSTEIYDKNKEKINDFDNISTMTININVNSKKYTINATC